MITLFSDSKRVQTQHRVRPIGGDVERDDPEGSFEAPESFQKDSASVELDPTKPVKGVITFGITRGSAVATTAAAKIGEGAASVFDAVGSLIKEEIVFSTPPKDPKPKTETPPPLREFASPPPKPQLRFVEVGEKVISIEEAQKRRGVNASSRAGIDMNTGRLTADAQAQIESSIAEEKKRMEAAVKNPYDIARARTSKMGAGANNDVNKAGEGSSRISNLKAG